MEENEWVLTHRRTPILEKTTFADGNTLEIKQFKHTK
jgi:hypothetical protein